MLPQPGLGLAFVAALYVGPPVAAAEPVCADERADNSSAANLNNCAKSTRTAKDAGEWRRAAQAHVRTLMYARQVYEQGRASASRSWYTGNGDETVHYGTSECLLASQLEAAEARSLLEGCIDLLSLYLDDLAANDASTSASARAATERREELRELYENIDPPTLLPKNPDPPLPRSGAGGTGPPPPVPSSPTRPRGLWAGCGTSAGLAVASAALLVIGNSRGRKAAESLESSAAAESIFIAGAVGLGVSLAGTAVFAGLLVRHRRTHTHLQTLRLTPWITRSGFSASISLRF